MSALATLTFMAPGFLWAVLSGLLGAVLLHRHGADLRADAKGLLAIKALLSLVSPLIWFLAFCIGFLTAGLFFPDVNFKMESPPGMGLVWWGTAVIAAGGIFGLCEFGLLSLLKVGEGRATRLQMATISLAIGSAIGVGILFLMGFLST